MALVDYERVVVGLQAHVVSKPHHGSKDLALKIAELIARSTVDESMPEQALRLYGVQFHEDLRAAARDTQARDTPYDDAGRSSVGVAAGEHGQRSTLGGHDGSRNEGPHIRGREPSRAAAA